MKKTWIIVANFLSMNVYCEQTLLEVVAPTVASDLPVIGSPNVSEAGAVKIKDGITDRPESPQNALFNTTIKLEVGKFGHWRFEIPRGGVPLSVGMATEFKEGYEMRSFKQMSGGNFAGAGAIVTGWGHAIKTPGTLDWYIERPTATKVVIYSMMDNVPQEASAEIEFKRAGTIDLLKPVLGWDLQSVSAVPLTPGPHCNVRVYESTVISKESRALYHPPPALRTNAEGSWRFLDTQWQSVEVNIRQGRLFLKVANSMNPNIVLENSSGTSGRVIKPATPQIASTMMMPLGDDAAAETWLTTVWIPNVGPDWKVANGQLALGGQQLVPAQAENAIVSAEDNVLEQ